MYKKRSILFLCMFFYNCDVRSMGGLENHSWIVSNERRSHDFSPDGTELFVRSSNNVIEVWDLKTETCIHTLGNYPIGVQFVKYNADGSLLATVPNRYDTPEVAHKAALEGVSDGMFDETIRLWDTKSGECIQILQGHTDALRSAAWDFEGKRIASGSSDHTVRLWDVSTGECTHVLQHEASVPVVCWSLDGKLLATASKDRRIRIWDTNSGECLHIFNEPVNDTLSLHFSRDGKALASGGADRCVRVWNLFTGNMDCVFEQEDVVSFVEWNSINELITRTRANSQPIFYTFSTKISKKP